MSVRETLDSVLENLPDDHLREVLAYAEFISTRQERDAWKQFSQIQFARAYGPEEPEYTTADIKKGISK